MMSRTLAVCMVLAPNLCTFTYACPHAIVAASVAASAINLRPRVENAKQKLRVRDPVASPARVEVDIKTPTAPKPAEFLLKKDDAWRSVASVTPDLADAEISDARLSQREVGGGIEWRVVSPITFEYAVREVADVLDPANDALIFGHIGDAATLARAKARELKRVVVVDEAVHALFGERIEAYFAHYGVQMKLLVLPTTEENKDMEMVLTIAEAIHDLGVDRRLDPVIAIGGGVCMDIVGFAASIYRRRTPYIRVPTTLMGYVDASVGAKTGVNFAGKKNKLGAYIPPALTLLDRSFLATLDERQLANGAAEIAKMALVKDPELYQLLGAYGHELIEHKFQDLPATDAPHAAERATAPSRVLYLAIQTMLEELAPNLWEDSLERLVDFGHVFSLELEMAALFDDKLFHGEAVAIDMALSACLSHVRGHIDSATLDDILIMMRGLALPVYDANLDDAMCETGLYERNKFSSGQKLPLLTGAGEARIFEGITQEQVVDALAVWKARCA